MWKAPSDVRILPPHLFTLFTTSLLFLFLLFIIKCFGLTHFFMDRCREACWEWSLRKSSVRHQNQLPFPHGRRGGGKSARARGWWGGRAAKGCPLRHSPIPAQALQVQSSQTSGDSAGFASALEACGSDSFNVQNAKPLGKPFYFNEPEALCRGSRSANVCVHMSVWM